MKAAVVVFPGSNRERDMAHALKLVSGRDPAMVWHAETELPAGTDLVVLPGGFSYGDYLRCGAIAKFSPIMKAIGSFAADGGLVMGFCNGFQILTESGLLPGALIRNRGLRFICAPVQLRVETTDSPFTSHAVKGQILSLPIAHGEGCYTADERTLDELEAEDRVLFRYQGNPNGSLRDIAGICNAERNVLGMMPHPERAIDAAHGGTDGRRLFEALVAAAVRA
jgi:phosphoribosylformylglycinamidine synthase I